MTNDELKKKIANIIDNVFENRCRKTNCQNCDLYPDEMCQPNMYADALIAAGIGDVKDVEAEANRYEMLYSLQSRDMALAERKAYESEHRSEVAERALDKAVKLFYEYRIESDVLSCSSCWIADEAFKKCEAQGLYKGCSQRWKEEILIQAEKELAEEKK